MKFNIGNKVIVFNVSNFLYGVVEEYTQSAGDSTYSYLLYDDKTGDRRWVDEINLLPYIEQDTKEDTPQEDKPKYEVKDKVLYGGDIYEIFNISMDNDKYIYDLKIGEFATISIKEADLTPYVDRVSLGKQATVGLDYEAKEDLLNRIIVIAAAGINDDRLFEECLKDIISQYEISELI